MSLILQELLNRDTRQFSPQSLAYGAGLEEILSTLELAHGLGQLQTFKLTEDFTESAWKMMKDHSVFERMMALARPLADHMWIELPVEYTTYRKDGTPVSENIGTNTGFYLLTDSTGTEIWPFITFHGGKPNQFAFEPDIGGKMTPEGFLIGKAMQEFILAGNLSKISSSQALLFVCAILAMMNIPGAAQANPIVADAKLQRARAKAGKLPLISYTQLTMKAGGHHGKEPNDPDSPHEPAFHKRRHHVIGHIRLRRSDEPLGEWTWVRPHWRGDASLGIILKERTVEK